VLLPYSTKEANTLSNQFYKKYYSDSDQRSLILGINPGRNGAGLTGIPFTDSKRLIEKCQIQTDLKSHEPSSEFIYNMIDEYGGPELFYRNNFISSVSPIGFIKDGKNYNYYDESKLIDILNPYIVYQMFRLLQLKLKTKKIICLGEGKNFKYLNALNVKHKWFGEIIPLAHPRFIMQYKRPRMDVYIDQYINALKAIC
jgi:Domain of unknown function (DUF4918)